MKVLIGTPVYRRGAYALEKFLLNQQQVRQNHGDCCLLFSTAEADFVGELKNLLERYQLKGEVILSDVRKPDYARSYLWNIAAGREAVRRYFVTHPEFDRLLFLDADMTFDPSVASVMEREIAGCDAVFSGYRFRNGYVGLTGAGCFMLNRKAAQKISFRCYEFQNGQSINEDNVAEADLFARRCRIRKGFFLAVDHYTASGEVMHLAPQRVGLWRGVMTSALVRFLLIRASVALHYNLPKKSVRIFRALRG